MSFTHTHTSLVETGGRQVKASKTYTGGGNPSVSESIADSETDLLVVYAVDVSAIQSIIINSTQDITIKTNSSGAPDETLAIVANASYVWTIDSLFTNELATDITALYVTNSSGAAAQLDIEAITDVTP